MESFTCSPPSIGRREFPARDWTYKRRRLSKPYLTKSTERLSRIRWSPIRRRINVPPVCSSQRVKKTMPAFVSPKSSLKVSQDAHSKIHPFLLETDLHSGRRRNGAQNFIRHTMQSPMKRQEGAHCSLHSGIQEHEIEIDPWNMSLKDAAGIESWWQHRKWKQESFSKNQPKTNPIGGSRSARRLLRRWAQLTTITPEQLE